MAYIDSAIRDAYEYGGIDRWDYQECQGRWSGSIHGVTKGHQEVKDIFGVGNEKYCEEVRGSNL